MNRKLEIIMEWKMNKKSPLLYNQTNPCITCVFTMYDFGYFNNKRRK